MRIYPCIILINVFNAVVVRISVWQEKSLINILADGWYNQHTSIHQHKP